MVHATQVRVAQSLFGKMQASSCLVDAKYDGFGFFFILPALNTLQRQTIDRVLQFLDDYNIPLPRSARAGVEQMSREERVTRLIFKTGMSDPNDQELDRFRAFVDSEVKAQPRTLFLCIHDEAHWGASRQGLAAQYLELCEACPNVLTLQVSGTPYNLQTRNSRVPTDHELDWLCEVGDSEEYYGLKRFVLATTKFDGNPRARGAALPRGVIVDDASFEAKTRELVGKWRSRVPDKAETGETKESRATRIARTEALAFQYTEAFRCCCGDPDADEVAAGSALHVARDLISEEPTMAVIRCASNELGKRLHGLMQLAQSRMGLTESFAVLLDLHHLGNQGLEEQVCESGECRRARVRGLSNRVPPHPLLGCRRWNLPCWTRPG